MIIIINTWNASSATKGKGKRGEREREKERKGWDMTLSFDFCSACDNDLIN